MISEREILEILAQYKKHGWIFTPCFAFCAGAENLSVSVFGDAETVSSETNAAWFSRPAFDGGEAWELRSLSAAPFALVEVFEADDDEEVREEIRSEMQTRLAKQASKPVA